jgi:nucleotide-binding universal stress UspA family protein
MANACPTLGFEKVLLATDGSDSVQAAIQEAISLAKFCGSRLSVISVVEVNPEFGALAPEYVEKAENETREHLESIKQKAAAEGIECDVVAHQGEEPYQFIVEEAKKINAGVIVLGTHGRTGLKRLMMGSVASRVIGHAPCKVMIVPC